MHAILEDVTKIGRHLDNNLVIQDVSVSRHHAELRLENEQFVIYDLGSTGGMYVNGNKVDKSVLYSGDSILLASSPIVFVQNAPRMAKRSQAETGPLGKPGPDDEPTAPQEKLDWRP